jgi:hypothetical protein
VNPTCVISLTHPNDSHLLCKLMRNCLAVPSRPRAESGNIVTWSEPDTMPSSFGGSPPAVVKKRVCVITGQPARYLDPVTGHPYATLDAFKKIRAQAGIA